MPRMVFTPESLEQLTLAPDKTEERWFDSGPKAPSNFGLIVVRGVKGTSKTWCIQHWVDGRQRTVRFGRMQDVPLAQAHEAARRYHSALHVDQDPVAKKRDKKAVEKAAAIERAKDALTFGKLVPQFLAHLERNKRSPKHVADTRRYLDGSKGSPAAWGALGPLRVDRIDRKLVAAELSKIATKRGAIAGNRARIALGSFFSWALGEGVADNNPVVGTNKPMKAEAARDRVLTDDELAAVWKACRDDEYGKIVRLLALTACRREEVASMTRAEIDLPRALWTIPGERTKNGRPHEVPLSAPAVEILESVPAREKRDLLFGEGEGGFSGWSKGKRELDGRIAAGREKAGLTAVPEWRLHDLRRTAATRMGDIGVQPHVVEAALNHVSGTRAGVAGVYNRALYRPEKRAALDRWADHVMAITSGKPSNVVPIRSGAAA